MDVTVTDQGAFRFDADQWVEKPSGYRLLDLEGTLQGEVLSGQSPTRFFRHPHRPGGAGHGLEAGLPTVFG